MPASENAMTRWLDGFFELSKRQSSIPTEVRAGFATFFSLSYIFVLAPTLLSATGLDARSSLFAIVVLSSLSTLAAGFWARLPFAFAPGLEMLLYISFVAIPMYGLMPGAAVACVLASGIILFVLAVARQTHKIHNYPPAQFSDAVAISMSVFLLAQACQIDGLISYNHGWVHFAHHPGAHWVWGISGGVVALILDAVGVPGPVLVSVLLVSILAGSSGIGLARADNNEGVRLGLTELLNRGGSVGQLWPAVTSIFSLLVLSLYGSLSKIVNLWQGTSAHATRRLAPHDDVPRMNRLMVVEGLSAIASGLFRITNITMFVESGAGIRIGGRTGIASIVTGGAMLSGLLLIPYIRYINPIASVGALLYVGILFFPKPRYLRRISSHEWFVIGMMAFIITTMMSLFWAFFLGLVGFVLAREIKNLSTRKKQATV
jgi:AGZA family xanthine/uracil permease-like MFS transporter